MRRSRVLGLAEMMNFPGVVAGAPEELEKLELDGAEHVDGHAPGLLGKELQAYAAAGIRSDHEALTVEEGRERLRAGMWLLVREASMARNLVDLLPLVEEYGPGRLAFCTDDRDPDDIADDGHVNGMVRKAVAAGVAPEDALLMASFHPALWHGLRKHGAIAPGYQADLLLLPDLVSFVPETVLKRGRPLEEVPRVEVPDWVRQTVRIKPVSPADLAVSRERQRSRDRPDRGPGRDRVARAGRGRSGPREDRRRRAPPGDRADRRRLHRRLGAAARRARLDGRARRAQPGGGRDDRRRHGLRDRAARRDRRRHRRRRGSARRSPSARCRSRGSSPTRRSRT